jgi:L-2-hydroxyglutarate oxidase LhgO
MKTLQEHIDDLDKMIDGRAAKDEIRSQIAFIGREVAALEADYAQLAQAHAALQDEHTKFKEGQSQKDSQAWNQAVRKANEIYED